MIRAAGADTFGFDCVCLSKGILWGWSGKKNSIYGGAVYGSNGVPDINDTQLFARCSSQSSDFCNILPGEAVWLPGHIGVYIGNGLAVECTPAWKNDVQITSCNCDKAGYHRRNWQKHGRCSVRFFRKANPVLPAWIVDSCISERSWQNPIPFERLDLN